MKKRGENNCFFGKLFRRKKAQVWVETVIYTLIAFALIGAVLSFVKPKISELQDRAIIDQSIVILQEIDNTMFEIIQKGAGNKRKLEIGIKKGALTIDGVNDEIIFELDSSLIYSEPGKNVSEGNVIIHTGKGEELNKIILKIIYTENYNITFNGKDEVKSLTQSEIAYNFFIENKGGDTKNIIDISVD